MNSLVSDILMMRSLDPGKLTGAEILSMFLEHEGTPVSPQELHLLIPERREGIINRILSLAEKIFGKGSAIPSRLESLRVQLNIEHQEKVVLFQKRLLSIARAALNFSPEVNFFEIEGIRIPLAEFSRLHPAIQEYLVLDLRLASANVTLASSAENKDGFQSLFRSPLVEESNRFHSKTYYDASADTNFEPYEGMQVHYFRSKPGYSNEIFEFQNIPKFLIFKTESHSISHPEVRLRFRVRTNQIKIK
ncbi:MAG: hypothetical protein K2X47_01410 [Bdellovibrionales bacterium]|nr:hypothetical protein [Bdellovibrionales bacterium]